jgi:hypothetical protein
LWLEADNAAVPRPSARTCTEVRRV